MRFLLILSLLFINLKISAQNLSVTSFELDEVDQTANLQGTTVLDQNGEKCALIKILTNLKGYTFDVGALGVQKVVDKPGEIWVYVPRGVRKITITNPKIGQLRDYALPVTLKGARTYLMKLKSANVRTIVEEQVTAQYLVIKVEPKDAVVLIDNKPVSVTNGYAMTFVPFGQHTYKVFAQGYFGQEGTVTVADAHDKVVKEVTLVSDQAPVSIRCDMSDAEIWVNNVQLGHGLWMGSLASGTYFIEARKVGYNPTSQLINISSQDTLEQSFVLPPPTPAYGKINVQVIPASSEVYLDNDTVVRGLTPCILDSIPIGTHTVRVYLEKYTECLKTFVLEEGRIFDIVDTLWNVKKHYPGATQNVDTLTEKAIAGDVVSQRKLALHLIKGVDVQQDEKEAVKWYKQAADQGDVEAQYNLGVCCYSGIGTRQNFKKAVMWFQKAADQGDTGAMYNLGICYLRGEGVVQSSEKASEYFIKSGARQ